jgi:GTPase SAR1 family protein
MKRKVEKEAKKVVILGSSSVGKSCLINRFVSGEYNDEFKAPTIGLFTPLEDGNSPLK